MAEESRSTHKLYEKDKIGEVQIADEVVAIIAGLAATEVEGVDSMAGNITCLLYTSPSPRDGLLSRMPSSA